MSKCSRCNIDIKDDSLICPLCRGVINIDSDRAGVNPDTAAYVSRSVMYPDVGPAMRRLNFILKLVIFIMAVIEIGLCVVNYLTYDGFKWSIICGLGFFYVGFCLIYSVRYNRGHRRQLMAHGFILMALGVVIDSFLGFRGWSLEIVLPVIVMTLDVVILILMIVNSRNFQSYLMMQLYTTFFCIVMMIILLVTEVADFILLDIIASGVSGIMLVATLVFGDKRATGELVRRFRI